MAELGQITIPNSDVERLGCREADAPRHVTTVEARVYLGVVAKFLSLLICESLHRGEITAIPALNHRLEPVVNPITLKQIAGSAEERKPFLVTGDPAVRLIRSAVKGHL